MRTTSGKGLISPSYSEISLSTGSKKGSIYLIGLSVKKVASPLFLITSFSSGDLKNIKSLLDNKVLSDFNEAIKDRKKKGFISETTFIGINSADIKNYNQQNNMFEVTVDFVSEIISCVKDNEKKLVSGDPEKIKKV